MKFKVQEFTYDEDNGYSTMRASSKYGELFSHCRIHPEDKELQNQWDAYRFCEYKIAIQFMKYRVADLKARYEAAQNVVDIITSNAFNDKMLKFSKESTDFRFGYLNAIQDLQRQADGYWKVWQRGRKKYNYLKNNYLAFCDMWLSDRKKLREVFYERYIESNKGEE